MRVFGTAGRDQIELSLEAASTGLGFVQGSLQAVRVRRQGIVVRLRAVSSPARARLVSFSALG